MNTIINFEKQIATRECGGCTLCCKLVPVHELHKQAGERCKHQRVGKGCAVYNDPGRMPMSCMVWSCRWLNGDDTAELRRPDRSRYVIDCMPDFVSLVDNATGKRTNIEVIQIWCDPKHRDAWQEPALLDYLERRGREGKAALIRFDNREGITVFPPAMTSDGKFHVREGGLREAEHSFEETLAGIASAKRVKVGEND